MSFQPSFRREKQRYHSGRNALRARFWRFIDVVMCAVQIKYPAASQSGRYSGSAVCRGLCLGLLIPLWFQIAAQQPLAITDIHLDEAGRVIVQVPTTEASYGILYRGSAIDEIETPVALEIHPALENPDYLQLVDGGSHQTETQFYRVWQLPVNDPLDHDGDGLDDVYELTQGFGLDPLNSSDALLDPDGDERVTLEEYRHSTHPFYADLPELPPTLYAMPTNNTPFDPFPDDPNRSLIQKLLMYAFDTDGNTIPLKIITIKNNTLYTVYPVLRDGNESVTSNGVPVGLYDPYDPPKTEFRGYIGFQTNNQYYFGLPQGKSITVRVPLVFWNAARMGIMTDGRYLTPGPDQPNPYYYNTNSMRVIVAAESSETNAPANPETDGVVMWYRADLLAPALDSPDQLVEWTFRDRVYLSNPQINHRTGGQIPDDQKVTLINYDVSYVDNMHLPVAMEALDVPVPAPPVPFTQNPGPYGWIGSTNSAESLQAKLKMFTSTNNILLGSYFGTNGWPFYNIPPDQFGELKIPSAQNVFAQSPLAGAKSTYDLLNNHFMLSSGGTGAIQTLVGGAGTNSTGNLVTLSSNEDISKIQFIKPGYSVEASPPAGNPNPIQPGTTVSNVVHISNGPGDPSIVQLTKDLVASQEGCVFTFTRPITDYASEAMAKLWYSWVNQYLERTENTQTQLIVGEVITNRAILKFSAPVTGLIEGMQVTGAGIDNADPSENKGGVVILAIASDQMSVTLSQLARETHLLSEGQQYTFIKPQVLADTPTNLFSLDFSGDPIQPARDPSEFSKKVYLVMASMAQIPQSTDTNPTKPYFIKLMNNVIGGNMGFIFDTDAQRFSHDGLAISALIRDMIKSVLRGVTDFELYPEFDAAGTQVWYPTPTKSRGGLPFNAYNLDPFVWFVHVQLDFSGYGFSLDDDTSDVGANDTWNLRINIGGSTGLTNLYEWTIQAIYGPVTGPGYWNPTNSVSFYLAITGASDTSPIVITSAMHGLSSGDVVTIEQVKGNTAAIGTWTVGDVTTDTFQILNTAGNGAYTGGGQWTKGPHPIITGVDPLKIYWKIKGDDPNGGFTGALISGPGVQKKGTVRVVRLGNNQEGILALNTLLTNPDGSPLPEGTYTWTFSGN